MINVKVKIVFSEMIYYYTPVYFFLINTPHILLVSQFPNKVSYKYVLSLFHRITYASVKLMQYTCDLCW